MSSPQAPADASAERPRPARRRRRRGRRVLFGLILFGLLAAGQELLFRLVFPIPEVAGFNRIRYQMLAEFDPRFKPILRRGLVYDRLFLESKPVGWSETHWLNLYGFRGGDFAITPSPGRPRVLVIGDSVTEGQGAPASQTISAELDRLLQERGRPSEVLNLGVIAGTLQNVTALTRDAVSLLRPSQVVVVLFANDLPAPPYLGDLDRPAPTFPRTEVPFWMPRVATLAGRLANDESIYSRLPRPAISYFAPAPDGTNPFCDVTTPPAGVDPELFRAMKAAELNPWLHQQAQALPGMLAHDFSQGGTPLMHLRRMADACRQAGASLLVAYVPFAGVTHARYADAQVKLGMPRETAEALATDPKYRGQSRHLAAICPPLGIPLVDATGALIQAEAAGTPQFWTFDTHPRPVGYATIARTIAEGLGKQAR